MKRLLHIIASPREDESRTLEVSHTFLEVFKNKYPNWLIDELNLAKEDLPSLTPKSVAGKYVLLDGHELFGSLKQTWNEIIQHIDRFKSADLFLISTPMWNFSIPYMLKHYIDLIIQPRYLFNYTETGTTGLIQNKKMIVITTSGGQYSGPASSLDHLEPYLRDIFGLVGFTDFSFIHAESMDHEKMRKARLEKAQAEAKALGENIHA